MPTAPPLECAVCHDKSNPYNLRAALGIYHEMPGVIVEVRLFYCANKCEERALKELKGYMDFLEVRLL